MLKQSVYSLLVFCFLMTIFYGCQQKDNAPLPILGRETIVGKDTIPHKIPPFNFISQDSVVITNKTLSDHIYIADFFFTNCPSICPKVMKQMLRLHDAYQSKPTVKLVSHTLDPKRDSVAVLKRYANNLGVDQNKWLFLTGEKDELLDMADDYFVVAYEDEDAPGGFDHSGKIILVDKQGHVRAFCEGTDPKDVDDFFLDVDKLLAEYEEK